MSLNEYGLSEPIFTKDTTLGASLAYQFYVVDEFGAGIQSLSPTLRMTDPVGGNIALTINNDWVRFERGNIVGMYEIRIKMNRFAAFGFYGIEITPGGTSNYIIPEVFDYFVHCVNITQVTNAGLFRSSELPSSVNDFYKGGLAIPISGVNAGASSAPVIGYGGGLQELSIRPFPVTPQVNDVVVIRKI